MRRILAIVVSLSLLFSVEVCANDIEEPKGIYALSAVLMDAESGRILFAKEGEEARAMASTTKIMTCILALELQPEDAVIRISKNAQNQPKVRLGIREGEEYLLRDLLHSLMLESHNDVAVAIAEHVGGSVKAFANLMNQKAQEIGFNHTYFITPNGLDATDETGVHSTTAADLARMMSYCVKVSRKKERFIEITRAKKWTVTEQISGKKVVCTNHNAFLQMMDEALSGKTGYTNDAGYCYVGAVESRGRSFVVALLGSGWPNHKNYKWLDMKKLVKYGMDYYRKESLGETPQLSAINVRNGTKEKARVRPNFAGTSLPKTILLREDERMEVYVEQEEEVQAPTEIGTQVGTITYSVGNEMIGQIPTVIGELVNEKDFVWYMKKILEKICII